MNKISLEELLAQKAALEKQIAETQREEKSEALAQIRDLMQRYGLTLSDLSGGRATTKLPSASGRGTGSKVAAKYRDPDTGATWSGRGLKPKWLRIAIEGGRQLTDFSV